MGTTPAMVLGACRGRSATQTHRRRLKKPRKGRVTERSSCTCRGLVCQELEQGVRVCCTGIISGVTHPGRRSPEASCGSTAPPCYQHEKGESGG
jgi:hypothetical protein